ncbi:MAG: hypothetical protein AB7O24_04635 [Kofleriaceae bacterium]
MTGSRAASAVLLVLAFAGCGEPASLVQLVRSNPDDCAKPQPPVVATGLRVIAFASGGEVVRAVGVDEAVEIADFPETTEQIGVELLIGGGTAGAIGKSQPLAFHDLEEGAVIPVFMTPPGGACRTGSMTMARVAPLVARAGTGVLVLGGGDGMGGWLATAEFYDPATATFTPVDVPEVLGQDGFAGTALATMPDGRVVVTGGPQPVITVFDPATRTFGESVLIESRAFHTAVAVDGDHVLLAGGCSDVVNGSCAGGVMRRSSKIYDLRDLGMFEIGGNLAAARLGATMFDLGLETTGMRTFVAAGGAPSAVDPSAADRLALGGDAVAVSGTHVQAAALDGGGVLTAFAADADPGDGAASVIVPGASSAVAIARAPDVAGARLIALEDGRVAAIGGELAGDIAIYDPMLDRWNRSTPPAGSLALDAPQLIRLDDGSVLVLGGTSPSTDAWVYRPSLLGPTTGSVTVLPRSGDQLATLTAADPSTVARGADWQLTASSGQARAVVGGPRMITGSINATVRVHSGGLGVIAQQAAFGQAILAELVPGAPARLVKIVGDATEVLCTGANVEPFDPAIAVTVRLAITSSTALITRDGTDVLTCDTEAAERGAWGVAAVGAGARLAVDTVTVAR